MLQHKNINLTCMEVPKDDYTKEGLQMMAISSLYVINKIMDLLDTVCCLNNHHLKMHLVLI